jgi:general secretion pathway protein C
MVKTNLLTKKNVFSLNILLSILLVAAIIFLMRDIISGYFEKKLPVEKNIPASAGALNAERTMQLMEYAPIMKNNPFGFPGGEIRPLSVSTDTGVQQHTDLILIGTVSGPRELSYAVFKDSSGLQDVFRVGEPVYGMGRLYKVKKESVLFKKGEKITEIPIEDIVKIKEVRTQTSGANPRHSLFAQRIGRSTYVVDQARLQQMISNPAQIMTDARLRPNVSAGRENGYTLSEVKPGGIYQSLGLQEGDTLLRINEYDISNPEKALQAFSALKGLDRVQIDLMRSGARMTMTYQIK